MGNRADTEYAKAIGKYCRTVSLSKYICTLWGTSFRHLFSRSQKARQFCIENGLHDEEEGAVRTLTVQMEEAIGEKSGVRLDQPDRPAQTPESTNTTSGSNDTNLRPTDTTSGSHHTTLGSINTALGYNHKVSASTGRLQAIANLQKARARALQESTASFEQVVLGFN